MRTSPEGDDLCATTTLSNAFLSSLSDQIRVKKQVNQIANSIVRFGWTYPVITDENLVLLAGHGRLLAARQLGLKRIPVIVLRQLRGSPRRGAVRSHLPAASPDRCGADRGRLRSAYHHRVRRHARGPFIGHSRPGASNRRYPHRGDHATPCSHDKASAKQAYSKNHGDDGAIR
ncbi:MAG: ParB N-terminal domain-containing protein [Rhizobiales bacterium]|nr:ParB N-terminal domain-containing protein [Hyphomicrobiales bacterium]